MSGNLDARTSPGTAPRAVPSRGVRRLNRVPMLAICGLMGVVIFAVVYGFHERLASEQAKSAASAGAAHAKMMEAANAKRRSTNDLSDSSRASPRESP